jgi:SAM-dependent methyltransferase
VDAVDPEVAKNREAWEQASQKHLREYDELLAEGAQARLLQSELALLEPILATSPAVIHLQSGQGIDDLALINAGASSVISVDYSVTAATAAQRRATELNKPCRYVVAEVPGVPLKDATADLVYTGKGALIWMRDLTAWATDAARLVRPGGALFIYEAHPMTPLWTWDEDESRIRPDRSYFGRSHLNDSFPANGAREWQWTLGEIITSVIAAGFAVQAVEEYAEPFWRPAGLHAAAWDGRLPNAFALLARRH